MKNNFLPLALYIHVPWCVRKCPYCDFNSHRAGKTIPETHYIDQLIADLTWDLVYVQDRVIKTIFIGGGTPSLLSPKGMERILQAVSDKLVLADNCEITMEANPGAIEMEKFIAFKQAGINRLSIGVQSFDDNQLKTLGRIHNASDAKAAIEQVYMAGFNNFNLDLMHGLPQQTLEQAMMDIETAIAFSPPHLSWYQLTIEANTVFAKHRPVLPNEDELWHIEQQGIALLNNAGYQRYEISAYSQPNYACCHNINYWQFGDYLGIGAGAHSKLTDSKQGTIVRMAKISHPASYMMAGSKINNDNPFVSQRHTIDRSELPLEFMMNVLRLREGVPIDYFFQRTSMVIDEITSSLEQAKSKGWITINNGYLMPTELGQRFLNDCLQIFSD